MKCSILLIILFYSCTGTGKKNTVPVPAGKKWSIKLAGDLGNFEIELPQQLDTFFTWTEYSDCGDPCAKTDYRVQEKLLPVFKDNGFIYFPLEDSVYQFTIKHTKLVLPDYPGNIDATKHYQAILKSEAYENQTGRYIIDTVLTVGPLCIPVIAYNGIDTFRKAKLQFVNAMTSVWDNDVNISFEYRKSYKDTTATNFIQNAFEAIKTIVIRK